MQNLSYISGYRNLKKIPYISGNGNPKKATLKKLFIFQEMELSNLKLKKHQKSKSKISYISFQT